MIATVENRFDKFQVEIPEPPQFESEVLFFDKKKEDQYWQRPTIPDWVIKREKGLVATEDWWIKEFADCFDNGKWMMNNGDLIWLPPAYYFFLKWWKIPRYGFPEYRKKRLKQYYLKHKIRHEKDWIGSLNIKNRRDGETVSAMCDNVHGAIPSLTGFFGIQSKTGEDAKDVCWRSLMYGLKRLHKRFITNEDGGLIWTGSTDPSKTLNFKKEASKKSLIYTSSDAESEDEEQETILTWRATVSNAWDGREMKEITIDEFAKWEEDSALQAFYTNVDCVLQGEERVGFINMFSSPAEKDGRWNTEAKQLWDLSNPAKVDPNTNVSSSRLYRWFSDPLDGVHSLYDKYGNADPDRVYEYIMRRRNAASGDRKMIEIRKHPLDEEEAFGSFDVTADWSNVDGIKARKIYLLGKPKKENGESGIVIGRLDWIDNIPDTDVIFRPAPPDIIAVNEHYRFAQSHFVSNKPSIDRVKKPPKNVDSVLGVDNYDYRRVQGTDPSKGAAIQYKFRDSFGTGIRSIFPMSYVGRPARPSIFYEDMIKFAIYSRSLVQTENKNRNMIDYFEDRGYFDWLLPKDLKGNQEMKGNAPSGMGGFLDDGCALIDSIFSFYPEGEFYPLQDFWHYDWLDETLRFDAKNTHKFDRFMAMLQSVHGAQKLLLKYNKRPKAGTDFADLFADMI